MIKLSDKFKNTVSIVAIATIGAYGTTTWKDVYDDFHERRTERAEYFKSWGKIHNMEPAYPTFPPATDEELEEATKPVIIGEKICTENRGDLSNKQLCPSKPQPPF